MRPELMTLDKLEEIIISRISIDKNKWLMRRDILNDLFIPTTENIERFKKVNNHLIELSENLIRRECGINATLYYLEDCPSFDDNIIIETNMFIGNADNVLRLSDDSTYGSDFQRIIEKLISSLKMDGNQNSQCSME